MKIYFKHIRSKGSAFLVGAILATVVSVYAQDWTATVNKRLDEQTFVVTINGEPYMAFRQDRVTELFKAENDAKAFKNELQQERVKYSKLETLYGEQKSVLAACTTLSKNGGGILGNKYLQFGLDVAPTVTTLLRPCR